MGNLKCVNQDAGDEEAGKSEKEVDTDVAAGEGVDKEIEETRVSMRVCRKEMGAED